MFDLDLTNIYLIFKLHSVYMSEDPYFFNLKYTFPFSLGTGSALIVSHWWIEIRNDQLIYGLAFSRVSCGMTDFGGAEGG